MSVRDVVKVVRGLWGFQLWVNLPAKDKMCEPGAAGPLGDGVRVPGRGPRRGAEGRGELNQAFEDFSAGRF